MELIEWKEIYSVGIKEIDNQHKGLVILINELFTLIMDGKATESLNEILGHLTDYTKMHFSVEEILMRKSAYPRLDEHKIEHVKFVEKLESLKSDCDSKKATVTLEILNFLKHWIVNHILVSDMQYVPFTSKLDY